MGAIREQRGLVRSMIAAVATKPFLILAGISGSGKTQLARRLAAGIAAGPLGECGFSRTLQADEPVFQTLRRAVADSGVAPEVFEGDADAFVDVHPLGLPPGSDLDAYARDSYGRMRLNEATRSYHDVLNNRVAFLPVRPEWRDARQLWGTYNPLTGLFYPTHALRVVLHALLEFMHLGDKAGRHVLILDEMNLSRVEYYMSDLLSLMESPAQEAAGGKRRLGEMVEIHPFRGAVWTVSPPRVPGQAPTASEQLFQGRMDRGWALAMTKLIGPNSNAVINPIEVDFDEVIEGADWFRLVPPQICIPPNLTIIGTVNVDETTYSLSPKVLDRAFVVEFDHLHFDEVCGDWDGFGEIRDDVLEMQRILEPARMNFGYRVVHEWLEYLRVSGTSWREEGDFLIASKVLPKLRGTSEELAEPLGELLAFCLGVPVEKMGSTPEYTRFDRWLEVLGLSASDLPRPRSARRLHQMWVDLFRTGVTSFL